MQCTTVRLPAAPLGFHTQCICIMMMIVVGLNACGVLVLVLQVQEVNLFRERRTHTSKGCGFVTMRTRDQAVAVRI